MTGNFAHTPWIGTQYKCGINGRRVAISGYSHHGDDSVGITIDVVRKVIEGDLNIAFFDRIRDYFGFKTHHEFWPRVIFFNFAPNSIGSSDQKYEWASNEQKALGQERVIEILEEYHPNDLLVFTQKGWSSFPLTIEDTLKIRGSGQYDWQTYKLSDGHFVRATGLRHPQGAKTEELTLAVTTILALPILDFGPTKRQAPTEVVRPPASATHPTIQPARTGIDGIAWHILGQTYIPLQHSENSMAWHATLPPGTFVPPHSHAAQEEFVHVLSGTLDLDAAGTTRRAGPGDLVVLPRNEPHGLFNRGTADVECLFWVAPSARLWDLFAAIDGVADPAEIMRLAALHDVTFLPPASSPS